MKPIVVVLAVSLVASSTGCSVAFQDSVRSRSVYCSTSHFWYASDLVLAAADLYANSRASVPAAGYLPAGLFLASAAIGIYKRHHCVEFRETAPPEVWAAADEAERQRAAQEQADREARAQAAQAAFEAALQAQAEQIAQQAIDQAQQPAPDPVPEPTAEPQPMQPQPGQPRQRPVQPTITQTRVVVPPRGTLARSRQQCDAILPMPPIAKNDPFGNAQKMQQINRGSCYECVDPGRTFAMETPPSQGFMHSCQ